MTKRNESRKPLKRYPRITEVTAPRGTKYRVRYRAEGKDQVATFGNKDAAIEFDRETQAALARGTYIDPHDTTTVAEFGRVYLTAVAKDQRESTRRTQDSILRNKIAGTDLGRMPLVKVRREHIDAWLGERLQHNKRSSVRTHANLLRAILGYAKECERIDSVPTVSMRRDLQDEDDDDVRDVHPIRPEDARLIAAMMPTPVESRMVIVQSRTGLRIGELLGLRRCDVDFAKGYVKVTGQLTHDTRKRVNYAKTKHSKRSIPMTATVEAALREQLAERKPQGPEALVFVSPRTFNPYTQQSYGATFQRWAERAGFHPNSTTHDLRHGFALDLLTAEDGRRMADYEVAALLGHKDASLVRSTYSQFTEDDLERAKSKMRLAA